MPDTIYDVAIIGGGPAGYTAAIRAGQYGLKTALIEKDPKLGGTCLHVGCIPTKSLLFNAEVYDHLKHAEEYGIEGLGTGKLNWKKILDRKTQIVNKHTKGLDFLMRKNKVTVVPGFGKLTGSAKSGVHSVEVTSSRQLPDHSGQKHSPRHWISARMLPGVEAGGNVLTNIEILSSTPFPSPSSSSEQAQSASNSPPSSAASAPKSPSSNISRA